MSRPDCDRLSPRWGPEPQVEPPHGAYSAEVSDRVGLELRSAAFMSDSFGSLVPPGS